MDNEPALRVSLDERIDILAGVLAFAGLSSAFLKDLARMLRVEQLPSDHTVMAPGEPVDRLHIVAEGRVEISSDSEDGHVVLATQGRAEMFGELALISPHRRTLARRTARTLTPVTLLTLDAPSAQWLVTLHPDARSIFETPGETMLIARFLKRVSPFASVPYESARILADKLQTVTVPVGADIVRQGDVADYCYMLRGGSAEVLAPLPDGTERILATLHPGALIGETALLSDSPRNATVRATVPCELLALSRADLLETLQSDEIVAREIYDLLQLRDRPRQTFGIGETSLRAADGSMFCILKNTESGSYYRLAPEGWFVWQMLDGRRTLRDLTMAYRDEFGSFAPETIAQLVRDLARAGFVQGIPLHKDVSEAVRKAQQGSTLQRTSILARRLLEFEVSLKNVDAAITKVYRRGVFLLYTWPAQILLALVAVGGVVAFALNTVRAVNVVGASDLGLALLVFLLPAEWFAVMLHEAGHAFTVKAFNREVLRVGIGWYWYAPSLFVDTSDMWLAERWPRIAVSLAGPYANLIFGSAVALIGYFSSSDVVAAICWEIALTSFIMLVVNLNPLLEYDGYYVLMDAVDRPNLRAHSLEWIGKELPGALRKPRTMWSHRLELIYGLGAIGYVAILGIGMFVVYRVALQGYLSDVMPPGWNGPTATILALSVMALAASSLLSQINGVRALARLR